MRGIAGVGRARYARDMSDTENGDVRMDEALLDPELRQSALERIRALPLADRAGAFAALHESLSATLERTPSTSEDTPA